MAITTSSLVNTVIGDKRLVIYNITSSSETELELETSATGLKGINAGFMVKASGSTGFTGIVQYYNKDSSGVASNGCFAMSGISGAASQVYCVTLIGY